MEGHVERYPGGGWFAIPLDPAKGYSGPWRNQRAAEFALLGRYDAAHIADEAGTDTD